MAFNVFATTLKDVTGASYCLSVFLVQIIAGIVEHRISNEFSSHVLLVNMLSFVARTVNSYWGTQVRII